MTINVVTPEFIEAHSLDVGPLSDQANGTLHINSFRGVFTQPLGYIIIRVQVEGVQGYNEDQVALVIPDSTIFGSWWPVTLGTLTINQIINMIKESEIDELSPSLNGLRIAQLLDTAKQSLQFRTKMKLLQTKQWIWLIWTRQPKWQRRR